MILDTAFLCVQTGHKASFRGGATAYEVNGKLRLDANLPGAAQIDAKLNKMFMYPGVL